MAAYTGRPGVDWGAVAQAVNVDAHLQAQDEARKADAIRWQGQQDYQTLIDSGVDPAEALRRSSAKLFFNDPRGQAAVIGATRPATIKPGWKPSGLIVDGVQMLMTSPNSAIQAHPKPADSTNPQTIDVHTKFGDVSTTQRMPIEEFKAKQKAAAEAEAEAAAAENASTVAGLIPQFEQKRSAVNAPGISSWWNRSANATDMNSLSNQIVSAGGIVPPLNAPVFAPPGAVAPATAENAAMLTRRSFPAWGNMPPPAPMLAPMGAGAPVNTGPVQVKNQAEYDALPKGAQYLRSDGKVYTKK